MFSVKENFQITVNCEQIELGKMTGRQPDEVIQTSSLKGKYENERKLHKGALQNIPVQ